MNSRLVASCITAAIMGTATMSFGAGFKIAEQGAKAMAMGNAFAAQADDPSALAYNPAGIAFQKGTQVQLGSTTILVPQSAYPFVIRHTLPLPDTLRQRIDDMHHSGLRNSRQVLIIANRDHVMPPTFFPAP